MEATQYYFFIFYSKNRKVSEGNFLMYSLLVYSFWGQFFIFIPGGPGGIFFETKGSTVLDIPKTENVSPEVPLGDFLESIEKIPSPTGLRGLPGRIE
jgi:hypothetical protein